jgi:23S rRNA (uracil1939-C5)-methyltransferase
MNHKQQLIEIERLALQGDGVGRIAAEGNEKGKVAFVPYSLPRETIRAEKILEKKTYARWLPEEIVQSSPDRIKPSCPYHFQPDRMKLDPGGLWCGGCNWQHFPVEKQRETKRMLVSETLDRLGGFSELPEIDLIYSENSWRYRNNVQIAFGSRGDTIISGFRAPDSHEIVDIDDCLLQSSASVRIFNSIRQIARALGFIPYERHKDRGWLKHLLIRTSETGSALVILVTRNASFPEQEKFLQLITSQCPEVVSIYQNLQPARTRVITGPKWLHLWAGRKLEENLCGLHLHYSPGSFFQVNTRAASLLYQKAIKEATIEPGMTVLDLYCGVGGMSLMAAQFAEKVIGVDEFAVAIEDAQENARENGVANVTFFTSPVEDFLKQGNSFEYSSAGRLIAIVDPPRAGCRPEVIDRLLALTPRQIIYVSCDPATLARDLKLLNAKYQISTLTVVDLFPQTAHIETIARLDKKEA